MTTSSTGQGPRPTVADPGRLRGQGLMVVGVAGLTVMDATVKALAAAYTVEEIAFFRCLLALPWLLVALRWSGGLAALRAASPRLQLTRGVFQALTGLAFFHALALLPLADAIAISFLAPFLIAALSGPVLQEPVSRRSWLAIGLGFLGVLVVLRPGAVGVSTGAALALLAAVAYAGNSLFLRRIGRTDAAITTTIWGTIVPGLIYGALALGAWEWPRLADWPALAFVGGIGAVSGLMVTAAYRLAPAAVLAPLEYTALLWAVLLGRFLFGDVPTAPVILGSAIIVGSGILLTRGRR